MPEHLFLKITDYPNVHKSAGNVDYFLKLHGIEGESHDFKHKGEIDLLSWSWGETQSGTHGQGGGGGAGKVSMHDFHFEMHICKASPKLALACATGEHLKEAVLTCRKAGKQQQEFLKIVFTNLLISSYHTSSTDDLAVPTEQISLNFAKIKWTYRQQNADGTLGGTISAGYDLKGNREF
jgi:type VI secretion system secreted protein Hcp